jgi:uncharacterized membrane protein
MTWDTLRQGGVRLLPTLLLLWLAYLFGSSLRRGAMPLIERIARRSNSALPQALCRYTRRLTAIWCISLLAAALIAAFARAGFVATNAWIWAGVVSLFVGERWLRPRIFPREHFPGLLQQLRDTLSVWRTR